MKKTIVFLCMAVLLILFSQKRPPFLETFHSAAAPSHIVIDAGHGGKDPGKIGIGNLAEKEINLEICLFLSNYLTASGYRVSMTRNNDRSLASPKDSNQKLSDLKNRISLIEKASPMAVISIHQNSFPDSSVSGPQVFYPGDEYSEKLADSIQKECIRVLQPQSHRPIKESQEYYLFRHTDCPIVIVECGFLSNPSEALLLASPDYQKKTAWAISMGILRFLKSLP